MDSYRDAQESPLGSEIDAAHDTGGPVRHFWKKPASLHLRLVLLVAGTMLPLIALTGIVVYGSYRTASDAAAERVLQTTRSAMATVDRELQNQIAALEVLALSPALQTGDIEAFRADGARFLSRFSPDAGLSLTDSTGQLVLLSSRPPGAVLPRRLDADAVRAIFQDGKPYVSNLFSGQITGRIFVSVDVPVRVDGQVRYDLAFTPPRANFNNILKNLSLPADWIVSIADRNAHHISRIPAMDQSKLTSLSDTLKAQLTDGSHIVDTISLEGRRILTAFTRSAETGWYVAIGIPIETLTAPARRALLATLAFGAGLLLVGVVFASRLARQRMRAESHRELLVNELNHRVKNTLSSVQAIVNRGLRDAPVAKPQKDAIEARLMALSHAHNILSTAKWESATLRDIAAAIMDPDADRSGRIRLAGAHVTLSPRVAIALALILNELRTNAVKYGALSVANGTVDVVWAPLPNNRLSLDWTERGGPPAITPEKPGYGTKFIERAVVGELKGSYSALYLPTGLTCVIEISL